MFVVFFGLQSFADMQTTDSINNLKKVFKKEFPEISFQRTTPVNDEKEGYSVFGTETQATYVKWRKKSLSIPEKLMAADDMQLVKMHQGIKGQSACYYDYVIKYNSTKSRRICDVAPEKRTEASCVSIIVNDPLLQKEARCEEFIQAMLGCSRSDKASAECRKTLFTQMDKYDTDGMHPVPNPLNKPMPAMSEPGLADGVKKSKTSK